MYIRGQNDNQKEIIAQRIAKEVKDGFVMNLGVGVPMLVTKYIPKEYDVLLEQENGILGMKQIPDEERDAHIVDAGCKCVGVVPGGWLFDSATSFSIIRGGHLDMSVLGVFEVDETGSIANHRIPGGRNAGMGGAMDLANGAKKLVIATTFLKKNGKSPIVKELSLPATAVHVADMIVTDMCVLKVTEEGLLMTEIAKGADPEELLSLSDAKIIVSPDLKVMEETEDFPSEPVETPDN